MGLFGSLGKLGAKNVAKSIEDSRQERIQAYSQSNMVQFAQSHSEYPELRAGLLRFNGLEDILMFLGSLKDKSSCLSWYPFWSQSRSGFRHSPMDLHISSLSIPSEPVSAAA